MLSVPLKSSPTSGFGLQYILRWSFTVLLHLLNHRVFSKYIWNTQITMKLSYCVFSSFRVNTNLKIELSAVGLNLFCLLMYMLDIILHLVFLSPKVFWRHENFFWNRWVQLSMKASVGLWLDRYSITHLCALVVASVAT